MKKIILQGLTGQGVVCLVLSLFTIAGCKHPQADFRADNTNIEAGDTVNFQDQSTKDPDTWEWIIDPSSPEFIMGTGSASQNPVLRFSEAGSYDISLTVSNSNGTDNERKDDYIEVKHNHSPAIMTSHG